MKSIHNIAMADESRIAKDEFFENQNKILAELLTENQPYLEEAFTVLGHLRETYFSSEGQASTDIACKDICSNYRVISAILDMVGNVFFDFLRDTDAALGIESYSVKAYLESTASLYRKFADATEE